MEIFTTAILWGAGVTAGVVIGLSYMIVAILLALSLAKAIRSLFK